MRCLLVVLIVAASTAVLAQTGFKAGYFIRKDGSRTECLIYDSDWNIVPENIRYKMNESSPDIKLSAEELSEFKTGNNKYIRAKVRYDKSSQNLKVLSNSREPEWVEGDLLMRVVVDGPATLYYYHLRDLSLFFYSKTDLPVEQLIYKSYYGGLTDASLNSSYSKQSTNFLQVAHNLNYLNQLNLNVRCASSIVVSSDKTLPYSLSPLVNHFNTYNLCNGGESIDYTKSSKQGLRVKLTPGVDFASMEKIFQGTKSDLGSDKNFRIGVELESILPFKSNKWSIFIEPAFQQFTSSDKSFPVYKSVELSLGFRRYFYLGKNANVFVNAAFVGDQSFKAATKVWGHLKYNGAFGAGLAYKRISLEGRRHTVRALLQYYDFQKTSVILGIRIR